MPDTTAADHFESALGFLERGDKINALFHLQAGLLRDPNNAMGWGNRAWILQQTGHPFEAMVSFDRAIALAPDTPSLYKGRVATLVSQGRLGDANAEADRALGMDPADPYIHAAKAGVLSVMGDHAGAAQHYARAIVGNPSDHELHLFRGMSLLAIGRFAEGWAEYEWRYQVPSYSRRILPCPLWTGGTAKRIIVVNEQGLGDTLQFMRLASTLRDRTGAEVWLEVRRSVERIARTMRGVQVVAFGDKLPDADAYVSAMSLPHLLGISDEAVIPSAPYLSGCGQREAIWRDILDRALPGKFRIGLCWAGQARQDVITQEIDARRSMRLSAMAPLGGVPGVGFVSLQVGKEASQAFDAPFPILNLSHEIEDFYDTAALIECLDLVITVDTSVVHLAGAVGAPTWLLSRFDNCWRWLGDREDSPWYPTLRQFRQREWGNWQEVMQRVARELKSHVAQTADLSAAA